MQLSIQQEAVCEFVKNDQRSLLVKARAGTGKSQTGVESLKRLDPRTKTLMLAFNKSIVAEMSLRVPPFVISQGFNSAGHRICSRFIPGIAFRENKTQDIIHTAYGRNLNWPIVNAVKKVVSLAKANALVPESFTRVTEGCKLATMEEMVKLVNSLWLDARFNTEQIAGMAHHILDLSAHATHVIDYDDQVYLPVVRRWPFEKYQFVYVDEDQDLSPIQHVFTKRCLDKDARLLGTGDDLQALYKWRGADSASIETMKKMFNCEELPLTVSFRCPKSVIKEAQQYCPDIEAHPDSPEGSVTSVATLDPISLKEDDFILCRYNAPLFSLGFKLIKARVPFQLQNRGDIEEVIKFIRNFRVSTLTDLLAKIRDWELMEVQRAEASDEQERIPMIYDKADCVRFLTENVTYNDVDSLLNDIESAFSHRRGPTLSSIHRAKGLERNRVYIILPRVHDRGKGKVARPGSQEKNLSYVAVTRARQELIYLPENYRLK